MGSMQDNGNDCVSLPEILVPCHVYIAIWRRRGQTEGGHSSLTEPSFQTCEEDHAELQCMRNTCSLLSDEMLLHGFLQKRS